MVDDDTFDRVDPRVPRRALDHVPRRRVAGLPAGPDAGCGEIDVLRLILAVESRRDQPQNVHRRPAAPRGELAHLRRVASLFRHLLGDLADDVAQMVDLLLPGDVALGAARLLYVSVSGHDLPHPLARAALP